MQSRSHFLCTYVEHFIHALTLFSFQVRFGDAAVLRRPGGNARCGPRYRSGVRIGGGVGPDDVLQHVVAVAAELVLARRGRGAARRLLQPRKVILLLGLSQSLAAQKVAAATAA